MSSHNHSKVSIVIPTFNRRELIGEAIESVLRQTYRNVEVVIVDDASTDGTDEYIRKYYALPNVVYHRLATNGGPSRARNVGLTLVSGEYVAFLDSDDTLRPTYVEKLVYEATNLAGTPVLVQCQFSRSENESVRIEPRRGIRPDEDAAFYIYNEKQSPSMSTYLVSASTAAQVGFNESLSYMEDHDFFLRYFARNPHVAFIEEPLINYRNKDSSSLTKSSPNLQTMIAWFDSLKVSMPSISHGALALIIAEFAREHKDFRAWFRLMRYAISVGNTDAKRVLGATARWLLSDEVYKRVKVVVGNFIR